ncbi:MAG: GAF domain-containing protein [Chloroflexi bacterium]|nr:GAF domain-containing protein [Chloroflexota bacterium]
MKARIAHHVQQIRAAVQERPLLSLWLALAIALFSLLHLAYSIPFLRGLIASPMWRLLGQTEDFAAVAMVLFVAYRWSPRLGQGVAFLFLAAHVPYLFLDAPDHLLEPITSVVMGLIALMGVHLTARLRQAEKDDRASKEIFLTMSNASPIGVYMAQDRKFRYVSPQFQEYTGYSASELLGASSLELVAAEHRERARRNAIKMLKGERTAPYEHQYVIKSGETRWCLEMVASVQVQGRPATLGNFMDITERKRAEAEIDLRNKQLAALQRVSQAMAQSVDLKEVSAQAFKAALEVLRLDAGSLRTIDESTQELAPLAIKTSGPELAEEARAKPRIPVGRGLAGKVVQAGKPIVIEDVSSCDWSFYGASRRLGYKSALGVPLRTGDKVIGAIVGFTFEKRSFTKQDTDFLADLGNMVGVSIANAQLFEEQRRRAEELAALQQVSQAVSQSLDLKSVAERALESTLSIMDLQAGDIKWLDKARQELVVLCEHGLPPEQVRYKRSMPNMKVGQGLAGRVAQTAEPLVVGDLAPDGRRFYGPQHTSDFCSAVYLPLKVKGEVVGVISGMSCRRRAFTSADVSLMASLGSMVGLAMANADLFEKEKRRAEELAAIQQLGQAVTQSLDLDTVTGVALDAALSIVQVDAGTIRYIDEATQELVLIGNRGLPPERISPLQSQPNMKVGQGLAGKAAQSGEPVVVEDLTRAEGRFYGRRWTADYRSAIYVPLKVRGKVVGVIGGLSLRQRAFGPGDVGLVDSLGNMVALALANARTFTLQKQRAEELAALHQVGQAVSQSLDLATVARVALEATIRVLRLDAGAIRHLDESTQELVLLDHLGTSPEQVLRMRTLPNVKVGQGMAGRAAQSGEPLVVEDLSSQEGRFYGREHTADFQSGIWLPLKVGGTVVGVIGGFSLHQRTFKPSDTRLMADLGNMVGVAIANARLFEEEKRRAEELAALQQVSQAVSESLELKDIAAVALDAFLKLSRVDGGSMKYVDEAAQEFVLLTHRGLPEELALEMEARPRLKIYEGLLGLASQKGKPVVVQDASSPDMAYRSALCSGIQSHVSILLRGKNRLVGVISGVSRSRRNFTPAEIELLTSLGNMAAVAVGNARLFRQVETAAKEWRNTFDAMSDGVSINSAEFRIMRANKALASMLGVTPQALVGQNCCKVLHGTAQPVAGCPLVRATASLAPADLVVQESHLGDRWLHIRCDPVLDPDGRPTTVVHSVRDVTAEKKQHEILERLHRLAQSLSTSLDIETVLRLSLNEIAGAFCTAEATAGIALLEDGGKECTVVAVQGPHGEELKGCTVSLSAFPAEVVDLLFAKQLPWVAAHSPQAPPLIKGLPGCGTRLVLAISPLVVRNRPTGLILITGADSRISGPDEVALLATYSREISLAVENARLFTQTEAALRRRVGEMQTLSDVLTTATQRAGLDALLKGALKRAAQALGVERAEVSTVDESEDQCVTLAIYQGDMEILPVPGIVADGPSVALLRTAFQEGQPLVVDDAQALPEGERLDVIKRLGVRSCLALPLTLGGRTLGLVQFSTVSAPKVYSSEEIALGKAIAALFAYLIDDAQLYERIEKERSTLEAIITSMDEGLVVVDGLDRVAYCNASAKKILDVGGKDVVGLPVEAFERLFADRVVDRKKFLEPRAHRAPRAGSLKTEIELYSVGGERTVEATAFPIGLAETLAGTGLLLRDITREREVDRMKTEFISIASHELRTPMTVVQGFAELLLKSGSTKKESRRWVEYIHRESLRLSDIVEDLLNISKIEMGRLSVQQQAVFLKPIVAQLVSQLNLTYGSHSFCVDVPDDLPNLWTDPDKLRQVLYNLMDNSAKYSPHGGKVVVSASGKGSDIEAVISVSDQGIGIPEEEIPHLFTRFHRVRGPDTDGIRGTGLGLYIVKSLVEMVGGRVWVHSRLHQGSTFCFTVPLEKSVVKE